MKRSLHRPNSGQIIIVVAVAVGTLIGAMSLGVDVGVLYFNWMQIQKAADAAVIAGASYLPLDPATAIATADSYAEENGIATAEIASTTVGGNDNSISIVIQRSVPTYFARILGLFSGSVAAKATAAVEGVGSVNGMLPIGIDSRTTYTFGQQVLLMTGQYGPGNWGPLVLGPNGASNFANNVEYGYAGNFNIGDWVTTETGLMSGPTQQSFNARINTGLSEYPNATLESHTLNDPRVATVPMVNFANINGQSQVQITGFAELWLVGMDSHGTITTDFIQQVADGRPSANSSAYGAMQAVLIQ
jgi:hypothetical protein